MERWLYRFVIKNISCTLLMLMTLNLHTLTIGNHENPEESDNYIYTETENPEESDKYLNTETENPEESDEYLNTETENPEESDEYLNIEIEKVDDILELQISDIDPAAVLSSNERVVNNYTELKDALFNDNGITTVYFGADITMQSSGVRIHPNKTNVIVDGFNPLDPEQGQPYTLTDYNSGVGTFTDTIYINAAGPKTLLVRDLIIIGKNYYGSFSVSDSTALSNLVITYERVDYNGPQIAYHRNGLLRFIDCSVHIHGGNGGSVNQEFSEAKNLIFEGINTIYTETSGTGVFWQPYGGTFTIVDDSSLTLTSPNTSTTYGLFYANGSSYNVDIDIGERAALNITISSVVAPVSNVTLGSLTVQEGGAFHLTTTKDATEAVLAMGGNLTVNRGAAFMINGYGSTTYTVIAQRTGNIIINEDATFHIIASGSYPRLIYLYGRELICNDPASVLLYNSKRVIEATTSAGRVYVNAEQINYWNAVSSGGLDDLPVYRWKKADNSNFWIDGTLSTGTSGNFSSLSSNFAEGDSDVQPSVTTFSMVNARVLAFGRLELIVTTPTAKYTDITGVTAPGATVRISFSQQGIDYILPDVTADLEGVFYVNTGVPLEPFTVITIKSNLQYLTTTTEVTVNESESGTLEFTVPEIMNFYTTELSTVEKFAKRLDPDWHIVVSDTRGAGEGWCIYAQLAQPLMTSDNTKPVLNDALVFVNDSITPLTSDRLLIYQHVSASDNEISKIHWATDRGILIQIPINTAYSGLDYTAIIEWTLVDAP